MATEPHQYKLYRVIVETEKDKATYYAGNVDSTDAADAALSQFIENWGMGSGEDGYSLNVTPVGVSGDKFLASGDVV